MNSKEPTKLLWTGGWDSTFRLLQILLDEKKKVQPFYMIDAERNSLGVEIQSMDKLKRSILESYPHTKSLFLSTIFVNIETIEPDKEITEAFRTLKKFMPLGSQYLWLAGFCKQNKLYDMEMSIEDGANENIAWINLPFLRNNFADNPDKLPQKERVIYSASKILFQYFKFPIINLKKTDMFTIAREKGWMPVMEKTWFCYQPIYIPFRGLVPCGNCITCRNQKKYNFNWRVPFYSNWIQRIRKFKNTVRAFLK